MSWYTFLLFVHVALAVIWVGGAAMMQFFGLRALRRPGDRLGEFAGDIESIGMKILTPASLLALVSGILLVVESDAWGIGDDWIVIALVLYGITFFAGFAFFGPESGRIGKLIEAQGASSPEVQARIGRLISLSRLDLILLFLIIFDMTVKPELGDGGAITFGLVAAGFAAALVLWRAFSGGKPAESPATAD